MASRGVHGNADTLTTQASPTGTPVVDSEFISNRREALLRGERAEIAARDALEAPNSARREIPVTDTSNAVRRMDRQLPDLDTPRTMGASNYKKERSRTKTAWVQGMPATRARVFQATVSNPDGVNRIAGLNEELHESLGQRSKMAPASAKRVRAIDMSITEYEERNRGEHIVYAQLRAPRNTVASRRELASRVRTKANLRETMTFDGYIPATHALGEVPDGPDMVMEIRTRSGAYLGGSDTVPNADHLVARGRTLRPLAVREVEFVRSDGTTGRRTIVQMEDVS